MVRWFFALLCLLLTRSYGKNVQRSTETARGRLRRVSGSDFLFNVKLMTRTSHQELEIHHVPLFVLKTWRIVGEVFILKAATMINLNNWKSPFHMQFCVGFERTLVFCIYFLGNQTWKRAIETLAGDKSSIILSFRCYQPRMR